MILWRLPVTKIMPTLRPLVGPTAGRGPHDRSPWGPPQMSGSRQEAARCGSAGTLTDAGAAGAGAAAARAGRKKKNVTGST